MTISCFGPARTIVSAPELADLMHLAEISIKAMSTESDPDHAQTNPTPLKTILLRTVFLGA